MMLKIECMPSKVLCVLLVVLVMPWTGSRVEGRRRRIRPLPPPLPPPPHHHRDLLLGLMPPPPPPLHHRPLAAAGGRAHALSASFHDQDNQGYGGYRFGYQVDDAYTRNQQSRAEERDPVTGRVTGSYSVLEPDGNVRTVYYVSDERGFRAFVRNSRKPSSAFGLPPASY